MYLASRSIVLLLTLLLKMTRSNATKSRKMDLAFKVRAYKRGESNGKYGTRKKGVSESLFRFY